MHMCIPLPVSASISIYILAVRFRPACVFSSFAGCRHATSKIKTFEDVYSKLDSLGFRVRKEIKQLHFSVALPAYLIAYICMHACTHAYKYMQLHAPACNWMQLHAPACKRMQLYESACEC